MPSADFLGTSEPLFGHCFFIYFTKLPALTPLYVNSGALPDLSWGQTTSSYFIQTRKFATKYTVADTSLSIKDFVTVDSAAVLYAWFLSVGDFVAGTLNPPAQYKSDAVYMLTNGQGAPINTWTYHGCWPTKLTFGNLSTSGSDSIIEISATVSVDSVSLA